MFKLVWDNIACRRVHTEWNHVWMFIKIECAIHRYQVKKCNQCECEQGDSCYVHSGWSKGGPRTRRHAPPPLRTKISLISCSFSESFINIFSRLPRLMVGTPQEKFWMRPWFRYNIVNTQLSSGFVRPGITFAPILHSVSRSSVPI